MQRLFGFTAGCRGKMVCAVALAVAGVLFGMAPYFAVAGILSELVKHTLSVSHVVFYVGLGVIGETIKMLLSTVSSMQAHKTAFHILKKDRKSVV